MDCSPPGSSVHGILQARILEWVAISFSRGSSQPRDQTQISCTAGRFLTIWATREAFICKVLINSGERLWGIYLDFRRRCTLSISVKDSVDKEWGSRSNGDKWLVSLKLALVCSEAEERGDVEGSFALPVWPKWLLLSNPRIISPFWEKDISAWCFSKKFLPNT